jgi:RNA-binding protein
MVLTRMDTQGKALRAKAKLLTPIMQIGKNGLTQGSVDLIDRELEQKHLIKIKLLKGALPEDASKADRRALANEMAKKSKAVLVEQVGSVVVLYRK